MAEDFSTLSHVSPLLTNERLTESLSKWFKEPTVFTHWEYVSETGKGDSYLSELIRIKIHGTAQDGPKHVQVILKNIPKSLSRRLTYRSDEFFKNEISFYEIVLPALLEFQSKKPMKDPFNKYAKLVFSYMDGAHDVICLEDASLENFGSAVRQEGIDLAHCKLAFKVLAQFHAMSFAMKDQEPEKFNEIKDAIFETYYHERLWDWYERFWKRIGDIAIDAVEKEYPNTIYVDKIKEFCVPETHKRMIDAANNTLSTGVISHGDSWTNNFLFKYESELPIDAKIIDFQLSRCASPVLDLSFIIYACTCQDLRNEHYHELLGYYHEVLSTQIREMGSDPDKVYSWDLFMSEIKKYSFFGLAFSFESTPFIVLAPEDAVNMEMDEINPACLLENNLQTKTEDTFECKLEIRIDPVVDLLPSTSGQKPVEKENPPITKKPSIDKTPEYTPRTLRKKWKHTEKLSFERLKKLKILREKTRRLTKKVAKLKML